MSLLHIQQHWIPRKIHLNPQNTIEKLSMEDTWDCKYVWVYHVHKIYVKIWCNSLCIHLFILLIDEKIQSVGQSDNRKSHYVLGYSWSGLKDYLVKGKAITGKYYVGLTEKFRKAVKSPLLAKEEVIFHYRNVPTHAFSIAIAKLHKLCCELFPHGLYSYVLFPNLKNWLAWPRFALNEEVICEANTYIGLRNCFILYV